MLHIERQDHVVVWTIDRPAAKNALDHATLASLLDAVRDAENDRDVRAAVITGGGDAFVSGGDLRELRGRHSRPDAERLCDAGHALTSAIWNLPFPVIAALTGPAVGGGAELALACDMRVAEPRARIAFKQVRMGVTTAWGSVPRLVALVGAGTAARLLFTAREVGAAEARDLGLIDEVVADARATALDWAREIALGSPKAISDAKRLLHAALVPTSDVRALEREVFVDTWMSTDHQDAVEAYFERRSPRWQPR